jgi:hypothetical protein
MTAAVTDAERKPCIYLSCYLTAVAVGTVVTFFAGVQENDLTLCLFVWETWGTNCPGSTHMAVFDLNQWYKEQMPGKIVKGQASTYIAVFSLDEVAEASASSANSTNPLLDVKVDPASISQFTAVQSLEEHFYPSALAFGMC